LTIATGLHPSIEHREAVTSYPLYEKMWGEYWLCKMDGKVVIENDVWVAQKVIILDGVTVHDGAIIGAGAVVTKDVPPYAFVAGNPAVVKSYRFTPDIIKKLLYIKWWDWTDERVKDTAPYMKDINTFLKIYG
jgi:virginiamycin A acetyltransferase